MADIKSLQEEYRKGQEAQRAGALDVARKIYDLILSREPDNAEVLHALGDLDLQQGMLEQAESRFREALKINRYGVGFQTSLGDLLVAQNKFREAKSAYFEELRIRPEFALSHLQLGSLMTRDGDFERAAKHFQSALQFAPESAVAANKLGVALMRIGDSARATDSFNRALSLQPGLAEPQANLGLLKLYNGELHAAAECFTRALALDADCAVAYRGIGQLKMKEGNPGEAIAAYRKCVDIDDSDLEAMHALARILRSQGAWELALNHYQRACDLAPNSVELLNEFAALQMTRGDLEGATTNYERALQLRPSDQQSLIGYGRVKIQSGDTKIALSRLSSAVQSGRTSTKLLGVYALLLGRAGRGREGIAMLEQRMRKKMPSDEEYRLHFTLGKLLDADGSYDLAFHHFRVANEINRRAFDGQRLVQTCDSIIEGFSAAKLNSASRAASFTENLVFLVGLPCSGLRTIERLIARQARVLEFGPSDTIGFSAYRMSAESGGPWPVDANLLTQEVLNKYARIYIAQVRARSAHDTELVLDTTWRNVVFLGVIELLFPNARVVYCTRDARDIALSTYFSDLQSQPGMPHASNMSDIGCFINAHKRLMAHWRDNCKLPIHIVSYERMILDYEEEFSDLLQFLGLAKNADKPRPKSEDKQKLPNPSFLKSTSLRKYRHYRGHLDGLIKVLEVPPDKAF